MQRSQGRATGERLEKRLRHWQGVVISACEQSGRSTLPWLDAPADYQSWLNAGPSCDYRILLHPKGEYTLGKLEPPQASILLLIGPEGGISTAEHNLAAQAGFTSVRLGHRILRTETAAMAAIASLQALWGDCC